MRILLVEGELKMAEALRGALERERYVVDHADRLETAREASALAVFDLVLLDRTLPDGDGLALVAELRKNNPGLPVIVISARGDVSDRVAGLDEGADDYLMKPFSIDEMLARIRAVRRPPPELAEDEVRAGRLIFDLSNEEAAIGEERLDLPRREQGLRKNHVHRAKMKAPPITPTSGPNRNRALATTPRNKNSSPMGVSTLRKSVETTKVHTPPLAPVA